MVALTVGRKVGLLDVRVVFNLLIQCRNITITGYLTSIGTENHMYTGLEACIFAKYGKHKRQVMWEISEFAQCKSKTAVIFFDCVEMLKSWVVGITDYLL